MLRTLIFSKRLASGWEFWALKRSSQYIAVAVAFMYAYDYFIGFGYAQFAFVFSCTYSWFKITGKYRSLAAVMIAVGEITTYGGAMLFNIDSVSGSLVTLVGYLITTRFFSEGPADFPTKI